MPSDAKRTPPASGSAGTPGVPVTEDDGDPSLVLGYEAADPLLLAQLWGEPIVAAGVGSEAR
jgi:hypothetical protein